MEFATEDVRAQVNRILASPGFANSGVLAPMLRAVVRGDSIGGPEARELRARLIDYYAGPGKDDAVVIELSEDTHALEIRVSRPSSPAGYQPSTGRKLFMFLLCLIALIAIWVFYFFFAVK
ncbi:MAG TPA: hypothetical protein VGV35_10380 [Bryobacteraceae bacterium]|nr:hypothetical protein [Bryobacteraceae bacterium]